jgi:alkaline phosphatase
MTHNNSSGGITDSAASGTALATGYKVDNDVISVAIASGTDPRRAIPSDGRDLLTLLEQFKSAGKSTGLVTTSSMTDATPAAFAAHNPTRADSAGIASDYFGSTRPNVLFGGGATGFDPAAATSAGYSVVTNRTQLQSLNPTTTNAAGIFGSGQFDYAYDQSTGASTFYNANPYLHEMTGTALDILKKDSDGFFLMVENELTDSSGHLAVSGASKVERNIFEVRELARAVQKAVDFAATNPDTLILLTADHETGAFTANQNNGVGVLPGVTSGATEHTAAWVPVYAIGPNAGHATSNLDNTNVFNLVTTSAAAPAPAVRKTFRQGDNGYAAAHDTHVRADTPNSPFGSTATLVVDQDDNGATGNQPVQAVIRFDSLIGAAAGIPAGSQIRSAKLTLHTGNVANDDTSGTIAAHRLLVSFDDATTTWNNAGHVANNGFSLNDAATAGDDDYLATPESLFPAPSLNSLVSFDVTATMIAWMNDPSANYGWLLVSDSTNGWRWDSSDATGGFRPMLEVSYVAVPEPSACGFAVTIAAASLLRRRRGRRAMSS